MVRASTLSLAATIVSLMTGAASAAPLLDRAIAVELFKSRVAESERCLELRSLEVQPGKGLAVAGYEQFKFPYQAVLKAIAPDCRWRDKTTLRARSITGFSGAKRSASDDPPLKPLTQGQEYSLKGFIQFKLKEGRWVPLGEK